MRRVAPVLLLLLAACATAPASPKSLRPERDRAVRAGLAWLRDYLSVPARADELGVDAVAIFADFAASAADPVARDLAASEARRHARRLASWWLARARLDDGEVLDLLVLLSLAGELDLDPAPLAAAARREFARLARPDDIYGLPDTSPSGLDALSEHDAFDLLLSAYAVERAAAYGYDFGVELGLEAVLSALARRERLTDEDDAYRETHVAYVLSDYGRLRLRRGDAPATYAYLERIFPAFLVEGHGEIVAEIVDVLRSLGKTDADPIVRAGTFFLLATQKPDGSWGDVRDDRDPYSTAHDTWCAVMALQERVFLADTPYVRRLEGVLRTVRR